MTKPILKWVGGKRKLLKKILPLYTGQSCIVEPFFGGGAVSFEIASTHDVKVVANDHIQDVMDIYRSVKSDVDAFIQHVRPLAEGYIPLKKEERRDFYYSVRDRHMNRPEEYQSKVEETAALYFMLWTCYSGLYRTGKAVPGRFNTPVGFAQEKDDHFLKKEENLREASKLFANWDFLDGDFTNTLRYVTKDSFVFLDPPYRETYDDYTDGGFSEKDQLRLCRFFRKCDERGARVVLTNKELSDGFWEKHLGEYTIEQNKVKYQVNANCATVGRPETVEVMVHN